MRVTVESMIEVFRYLDLQLSLRSTQALAEAKTSNQGLGYEYNEWGEYKQIHGKKWRNSWLLGAVSMINKRFRDNLRNQNEVTDNSTALVVIRDAVQDKMSEIFPKLGKGRARNTEINSEAWSAGRQAGAGMDLGGKQVRGTGRVQITA